MKNAKKIIALLLLLCFVSPLSVSALVKDVREAGLVDKFEDTELIFYRQNLAFMKNRGVSAGEGGGTLIYRLYKAVKSVNIYTSAGTADITASVSKDSLEYEQIFLSKKEGFLSASNVIDGNYYLKMELKAGVTITKVEVNTTDNFAVGNIQKKGKALIDEFDDLSKAMFATSGLRIDNDKPAETNNDLYKVILGSAPDKANIVYKLPEEITAVKLLKFVGYSTRDAKTESIIKLYVSSDSQNYKELPSELSTMPNTGLLMEFQEAFSVPSGNKYLKIEWNGAAQNWSPKLGRIEIYYGPQPEGSIKTFSEEITEKLMAEALAGGNDLPVNTKGMEFVTVPRPAEVLADYEKAETAGVHPRLIANQADFDSLRKKLDTAPYSAWYQNVKKRADATVEAKNAEYIIADGKRLLEVCRMVKDRIFWLGLMWKMTDDEKYAKRAADEMDAVAKFPNWNPSHFLDVGEMSFAMALGYDWFYDYLSAERKKTIKDAILKFGINTAMPFMRTRSNYTQNVNNWNGVCVGGVGTAAAVLFDEEPELCAEYISRAVEAMPKAIAEMYPDGCYPEGLTYWDYGTRYTVYFLTALDYALGKDYGLSDVEGFSKSGDFILYASAPNFKTFNFSDAGNEVYGPQLYWLAKKFDKPVYSYYQYEATQTGAGGDVLDMLWYDADYFKTPEQAEYPLDKAFGGDESLTSFRNAWEDKNALFIAAKAGDNQSSHGDLDIGSFVLDSQDTRWAIDLGAETYDIPGYWEDNENAGRWTYYRKRAEGHNTLVINPGKGPDQNVYAVDKIEKFETAGGGGFAVIDMTKAYDKSADSVKRGIKIFDGRTKILTQDEINCKTPSEIYWFMHTYAKINIADGGKTAVLSLGSRKLKASLISDAGKFEVMAAAPLATSPAPKENLVNSGVSKLTVHLTEVRAADIAVVFEPVYDESILSVREAAKIVPLSDWTVEDVSMAALDGVLIDGMPLNGFKPDKFTYTVNLPKGIDEIVPVSATSKEGIVSIIQADKTDGAAIINIKSDNADISDGKYTIKFEPFPLTAIPNGTARYTPVSVEASDIPEEANIPENTLDGNIETRWSAEGEQWIKYDLGEEARVGAVTLGIHRGDARKTRFDIELSNDGKAFKKVYGGESSGATTAPEMFLFEPEKARYIRVTGHGNNENSWNSITEFAAYGEVKIKRGFVDIAGHWAELDIEDMADLGIAKGVSALMFAPNGVVTKSELAAMLSRAADVDFKHVGNGNDEALRSEMFEMCAEAFALAGKNYVYGDVYEPKRKATRAEAVTLIKRIMDS